MRRCTLIFFILAAFGLAGLANAQDLTLDAPEMVALGDRLDISVTIDQPGFEAVLLAGLPGQTFVSSVGFVPLTDFFVVAPLSMNGALSCTDRIGAVPTYESLTGFRFDFAVVAFRADGSGDFVVSNSASIVIGPTFGPASDRAVCIAGDLDATADVMITQVGVDPGLSAFVIGGDIDMPANILTVGDNFDPGAPWRLDLLARGDIAADRLVLSTASCVFEGALSINLVIPAFIYAQGDVDLQYEFDMSASFLAQRAENFLSFPANGIVDVVGSAMTLTGLSPQQNIFEIDAAVLSGSTSVHLDVPIGSTVLINVAGASVTAPLGGTAWTTSGVDPELVVVNFAEATSVELRGSVMPGTTLAPVATVAVEDSAVMGQFMCHDLSVAGTLPFTVNSVKFVGSLDFLLALNLASMP